MPIIAIVKEMATRQRAAAMRRSGSDIARGYPRTRGRYCPRTRRRAHAEARSRGEARSDLGSGLQRYAARAPAAGRRWAGRVPGAHERPGFHVAARASPGPGPPAALRAARAATRWATGRFLRG